LTASFIVAIPAPGQAPQLGHAILLVDIAPWDISIPDGDNLPPGRGSAKHGEAIYIEDVALLNIPRE